MKRRDIDNLLLRGYLYCMECYSFTPHISAYNQPFPWTENDKMCEVCGSIHRPSTDDVCKCGYSFEQDLENVDYDHVFHGDGCHFGVNRNYVPMDFAKELNCIGKDEPTQSLAAYVLDSFLSSLSSEDRKKHPHFFIRKDECNCRKERIYVNTAVLEYHSWYIHSMDCSNAIEWEYKLQCPICHRIMYVQDGNC